MQFATPIAADRQQGDVFCISALAWMAQALRQNLDR